MAENTVRFGYLTKEDMFTALRDGVLDKYNICYTRDTHEQFIIDESLSPIAVTNRIPVFSSFEVALESVRHDTSTYPGEIISIYNDVNDCFDAYIVNQYDSGEYYIKPIGSEKDISYDDLNNVPIVNIKSSITEPIDLNTLNDGYYKINYFINPKTGNQVNSVVGNLFVIETEFGYKTIKRIAQDQIFDYIIKENGTIKCNQYITDDWLKENKYVTDTDVDNKIAVMELVSKDQMKTYVRETVQYLVEHVVAEQLAASACKEEDIENLFK